MFKNLYLKINNHLNQKNILLIYLLILLGVLIPTLSGNVNHNFWYRLFNIQNSSFFNMMLFFAIGLNTIYYISECLKSYDFIIRYQNFKQMINIFIKDIIIFTIYFSFIALILSISGAILFSFGNFQIINHSFYNFSIIYYIIFFFIRSLIISSLINVLLFLLFIKFNKFTNLLIIIINSSLFMFISIGKLKVPHFYNMPILLHYYYIPTLYTDFLLELICSILEVILLIGIIKVIYSIFSCKKKDLL